MAAKNVWTTFISDSFSISENNSGCVKNQRIERENQRTITLECKVWPRLDERIKRKSSCICLMKPRLCEQRNLDNCQRKPKLLWSGLTPPTFDSKTGKDFKEACTTFLAFFFSQSEVINFGWLITVKAILPNESQFCHKKPKWWIQANIFCHRLPFEDYLYQWKRKVKAFLQFYHGLLSEDCFHK